MDFWDILWLIAWSFLFVSYLFVLFYVIADLFRDHSLGGFAKALWIIFLIFLPLLAVLIYLIARGGGMAERSLAAAKAQKAATDEYIKTVAGGGPGAADQIHKAKALLDDGTISQAEFDAIKAKALS